MISGPSPHSLSFLLKKCKCTIHLLLLLLLLWNTSIAPVYTEQCLICLFTSEGFSTCLFWSCLLLQVETERHRYHSQIWISLQPLRRQPQNQPSQQGPGRWDVSVPRLQLFWDHREPRGQSHLCMWVFLHFLHLLSGGKYWWFPLILQDKIAASAFWGELLSPSVWWLDFNLSHHCRSNISNKNPIKMKLLW